MLFNSYIFILMFLPICLLVYFALNHFKLYKVGIAWLIGMSLWFYGYLNPEYIPVIVGSILVNYGLYRMIISKRFERRKKLITTLGVLINLAVLGYFKYLDFFISNINAVFKNDLPLLHIVLPLGISFFTFQQISFLIDAKNGEIPDCDFLHYAAFVSYFPQLVAGPIVSHDEIIPQLTDISKKKLSFENLNKGLYIFTLGLAKKILLADTFGIVVDYGYSHVGALGQTSTWIMICAYMIQLYFDFSGYSDMAIGLGKMMNIDIPINFNSPYKATSITDLWKRWHITLTRFFTKYVYIPLGGSRRGTVRTYLNVFLIFFLSGIWHGANWTFWLWGALQGLIMVIERLIVKELLPKIRRRPGKSSIFTAIIGRIYACVVFALTIVIFRANSIADAFAVYKSAFTHSSLPIPNEFVEAFRLPEFVKLLSVTPLEQKLPTLLMIAGFVIAFIIINFMKNAHENMNAKKMTPLRMAFTALLLIWCIVSLSGVSTFLYFNF